MTVEGVTHLLPTPFVVIATENPIDQHGTYPLPEGQLDRFSLTVAVGYPERSRAAEHRPAPAAASPDRGSRAGAGTRRTSCGASTPSARSTWTRPSSTTSWPSCTRREPRPRSRSGASPRSMIALTRCAQARAISEGRDFVLPDDVKALAPAALAHRLIPGRAAAARASAARWFAASWTRSRSRSASSGGRDRAPAQAGRPDSPSGAAVLFLLGTNVQAGGCSSSAP